MRIINPWYYSLYISKCRFRVNNWWTNLVGKKSRRNRRWIGEIKFDAAKGFNGKSWKEDINIEAKTGDIGIKSTAGAVTVDAAGNFDVTALKIYLN